MISWRITWPTAPAFDVPLGGGVSRRNIAITFGAVKTRMNSVKYEEPEQWAYDVQFRTWVGVLRNPKSGWTIAASLRELRELFPVLYQPQKWETAPPLVE